LRPAFTAAAPTTKVAHKNHTPSFVVGSRLKKLRRFRATALLLLRAGSGVKVL